MAVPSHVFVGRALARAGIILVGIRTASSGAVRAGDMGNVLVGQVTVGTAGYSAQLADVIEENLPTTLTPASQKPRAGRDLPRMELLLGSSTTQSTRSAS